MEDSVIATVRVYFNTSYPWKCLVVRFCSLMQFNTWPLFPFRMVAKWSITSAMTNFIVTFIAKPLSFSSFWMIFQGYFTCETYKHSSVIFASNFFVAFSNRLKIDKIDWQRLILIYSFNFCLDNRSWIAEIVIKMTWIELFNLILT